jgi:ribosomal protein L35
LSTPQLNVLRRHGHESQATDVIYAILIGHALNKEIRTTYKQDRAEKRSMTGGKRTERKRNGKGKEVVNGDKSGRLMSILMRVNW